MTPATIRRMVQMVRAIRAGKWTNELPSWAQRITVMTTDEDEDEANALRAVQTAEAFILLAHMCCPDFNETKFLQDCGFLP